MNYLLYHKNPYYIGTSTEVLSMGTLYRYSMIVCYELTTFPCINFMCLIIMYYIHKLLLYVLVVKTLSVLCLLVDLWNTE